MENLVINIKNLSKVYALYNKPIDRLKEAISFSKHSYHKDFYALSDISFDIKKGETFGIIGKNGSGKSTLLKIITGVLNKTSGKVNVYGKVAALLELGAGFNMDYTGIENVYMNGTMMGFTKKEMDEKIQAIIEFADIGDFVYQPVKNYSSGMFVRLAFAMTVVVEPEILIVDEALSVGDIAFQSKCYKRMDELKKKGTTIVMVTHDLGAVIKYCDRVLLLHNGKQISLGNPHGMVDIYKMILAGQTVDENVLKEIETQSDKEVKADDISNIQDSKDKKYIKDCMVKNPYCEEYGDGKATFLDYGILDVKNKPTSIILKGEEFIIREVIKINDEIKDPIFTWTIKDKRGTDLTGTNTMLEKIDTKNAQKGQIYVVEFRQKMRLQGGEYLLSMSCTSFVGDDLEVHHRMYDVIAFTVLINENKVGIFDSESKVTLEVKEG